MAGQSKNENKSMNDRSYSINAGESDIHAEIIWVAIKPPNHFYIMTVCTPHPLVCSSLGFAAERFRMLSLEGYQLIYIQPNAFNFK